MKKYGLFFPLQYILVMRYLNFLTEGNRHVSQGFLSLALLAFGARSSLVLGSRMLSSLPGFDDR